MVETTEEIIGIGHQTVDPEKGTISVGPVNPNAKKTSLKDILKSAMEKSGARDALESLRYMFGMQKSPFSPEEQATLNDLKARKNQTVGDVKKAESFRKTQEENLKRAITPAKPWR